MKADYTYKILPENIIVIIDQGSKEHPSVTNTIDDVLAEIAAEKKILLSRYKVVYRDSQGVWDGYSPRNGEFILMEIYNEEIAVAEIKKINT